jgi:hypothetical protein
MRLANLLIIILTMPFPVRIRIVKKNPILWQLNLVYCKENSSMKITLVDLERVAEAISIKVSYEDLKTSKGGSCRVMDERRIIINKHLQNSDKINLLAKELGNFDLSGLDIPVNVRKKILREADERTGGTPDRTTPP